MSQAFNLTARINLVGPTNLRPVIGQIRRQLGSTNFNINIDLNRNAVRNINSGNRSLQQLNTTLISISRSGTNVTNVINKLSAAIASVGSKSANINNVANNVNSINASAQSSSKSLKTAADGMEAFGKQSALAIKRFAAFTFVTAGIYGLTNAVRKNLASFIDFNREMVRLKQVTGASQQSIIDITNEISRLSTSLGASSTELSQVAVTLAQAGFTANEAKIALEALAKSSLAATFTNINETTEGSIALMRQFGIRVQDLEAALSSINSVSAKFAVESGDVIAAIRRTGGVFASASKGVSQGIDALNEFVAVFTSVRATTRESAETIATGLRTIFSRIQRSSTIDALREFGVELTDAQGKFVGAYKAVELLRKGLSSLDPRDLSFSRIVEELGGFRQVGKVIPLIQQFATAQAALKIAQKGQGSLARESVTAQEALAVQIARVREEFSALIRSIASSKGFQIFIGNILTLTSGLIKLADAAKNILPALTAVLALRGLSALGSFAKGFGKGLSPPQKFASGGYVPGVGNRDTVPAMLTPGEFVIRKKAVQKIGVGNLSKINSGRKKFASGGMVSLSGDNLIRSSIRESDFSFQKKSGDPFRLTGKTPNKFNPEDKYKINIQRVPVTVTDQDIGKTVANKYVKSSARAQNTELSPKKRQKAAQSRGYAFEQVLRQKYGVNLEKNKFSRLDGVDKNGQIFEARSRLEQTSSDVIATKVVAGALSGRSKSEKIVQNKLNQKQLRDAPDIVDFGNVTVFEDVTGGLNQQSSQRKFSGGYIQKLMAGQLVKEGKPKYISPQQIILDLKDKKFGDPKFLQDTILSTFGSIDIVSPSGRRIKPDDALSPRFRSSKSNIQALGPDFISKLNSFDQKIREKWATLSGTKTETTRPRTPAETVLAKSQGLLFGAAGMFGRRFEPKSIDIGKQNGLKQDTKAIVFGSVLDRNAIQKRQRLEQYKSKTGYSGFDRGELEIAGSPTAKKLSRSFRKQSAAVIGKQNKTLAKNYINAIANALSPNSPNVFLDFDRTLAFGADKIGGKINKKAPDYSAFNEPAKVAQGLGSARLSGLGQQIKNIINKLTTQDPALAQQLLQKMFVVSARPSRTMPLIARWIRNQGIRIPPKNVVGVGGPGVNLDQVAIKKAESIMQIGAKDGSVFIDDDPKNISAIKSGVPNITTAEYGYTPNLKDPKLKRQFDTEEGYQFEKYINERLPVNLKTAMFKKEGEGIDFPLGLDANVAKYWFNDSRLIGVPVDTKRTITGPSTIKNNIVSYLKDKGFAHGGPVQKFAFGRSVDELSFEKVRQQILQKYPQIGFRITKRKRGFGYNLLGGLKENGIETGRYPEFQQPSNLQKLIEAADLMAQKLVSQRPKIGFASGGSVADTVPALLTPGEFVINKKAAKKIGSSRLHQLNRADKVQGFNSGGLVQRFATGGGAQPVTNFASYSAQAETAVDNLLAKIVAKIAAANPSMSFDDAYRQAENDMIGTVSFGAMKSADTGNVKAAELVADAQRKQVNAIVKEIRSIDKNVSISDARAIAERKVADAWGGLYRRINSANPAPPATGFAGFSQRAMARSSYYQSESSKNYAKSGQLGPLMGDFYNIAAGFNRAIAVATGSVAKLGAASKMSAGQMALSGIRGAGRGIGGAITSLGGGALNLLGLGRFSTAGRRAGAAGTAGTAGTAGAAAGGGGMGGMGSFLIPMIAGPVIEQMSKNFGGETTTAGRRISSMGSQAINYGATGAMVGSLIAPILGPFAPLGPAIGAAVGGLYGLTAGFFEAEEAAKQYAQQEKQKIADKSLEKSGSLIDKFAETGSLKDRNRAISALRQSTEAEAAVGQTLQRKNASSFGKFFGYRDESTQDFSARIVETQQKGAEQAQKLLVASMMKNVQTFEELRKTMNPADFAMLTQQIAEADQGYTSVRESYNRDIEAAKKANNPELADRLEKEKNQILKNMSTNLARRATAEDNAAVQALKAAAASAKMAIVLETATMSMKKALDAASQVLNKIDFDIDSAINNMNNILNNQASLTSDRLSRVGNILENPEAYDELTRVEAINFTGNRLGRFGQQAANMAQFAPAASNEALRIANTMWESNASNEEIGNAVRDSLTREIRASFGNSSFAQDAINTIEAKIAETLAKAEGDIDPSKFIEEVTGPLREISNESSKLLAQANKNAINSINALAQVSQKLADLEQQRIERSASLINMQAQSELKQKEILGIKIKPEERMRAREAGMATRLGFGANTPISADTILARRQQLVQQQSMLQGNVQRTEERALSGDPKAAAQLARLQTNLANVNNELNRLDKEFANLPNMLEEHIGDLINEMQARVAELENRKQARVGFAEKLLTSSPSELAELNTTYGFLQKAMSGQTLTIMDSIQAQKAYLEAMLSGKTKTQALVDAYSAFANQSRNALSMLEELGQISGINSKEFDLAKANLLENLARATGQSNNRFIQLAIQELRTDPAIRAQNDPKIKEFARQAEVLRREQVKAVEAQNAIDREAQRKLLTETTDAILRSFDNVAKQIAVALDKLARAINARTLSDGGMVYASQGKLINFQPRGTDTVPAMLTPGEFVVNRAATQKNLPLLQAINRGRGGIAYLADGSNNPVMPQRRTFSDQKPRKWINSRGNSSLVGTLVAVEGNTAIIEHKGKRLNVPINNLSDFDAMHVNTRWNNWKPVTEVGGIPSSSTTGMNLPSTQLSDRSDTKPVVRQAQPQPRPQKTKEQMDEEAWLKSVPSRSGSSVKSRTPNPISLTSLDSIMAQKGEEAFYRFGDMGTPNMLPNRVDEDTLTPIERLIKESGGIDRVETELARGTRPGVIVLKNGTTISSPVEPDVAPIASMAATAALAATPAGAPVAGLMALAGSLSYLPTNLTNIVSGEAGWLDIANIAGLLAGVGGATRVGNTPMGVRRVGPDTPKMFTPEPTTTSTAPAASASPQRPMLPAQKPQSVAAPKPPKTLSEQMNDVSGASRATTVREMIARAQKEGGWGFLKKPAPASATKPTSGRAASASTQRPMLPAQKPPSADQSIAQYIEPLPAPSSVPKPAVTPSTTKPTSGRAASASPQRQYTIQQMLRAAKSPTPPRNSNIDPKTWREMSGAQRYRIIEANLTANNAIAPRIPVDFSLPGQSKPLSVPGPGPAGRTSTLNRNFNQAIKEADEAAGTPGTVTNKQAAAEAAASKPKPRTEIDPPKPRLSNAELVAKEAARTASTRLPKLKDIPKAKSLHEGNLVVFEYVTKDGTRRFIQLETGIAPKSYHKALAQYHLQNQGVLQFTKLKDITDSYVASGELPGLSRGGIVYANNGMLVPYQPLGTDTVPAMLTPGEFVVNRQATQKNLPLLKSINSGAPMSRGGVVYASKGMFIDPVTGEQSYNTPGIDKNTIAQNKKMLSDMNNQTSFISKTTKKIDQRTTNIDKNTDPKKIAYRKNGGVVYASGGTLVPYMPRGTDTVPAMLTPGEFVVNRAATQQNLPLLKSINEGNYKANGGIVQYLADGGQPKTLLNNRIGEFLKGNIAKQFIAYSDKDPLTINKNFNKQETAWTTGERFKRQDFIGELLQKLNDGSIQTSPKKVGDRSIRVDQAIKLAKAQAKNSNPYAQQLVAELTAPTNTRAFAKGKVTLPSGDLSFGSDSAFANDYADMPKLTDTNLDSPLWENVYTRLNYLASVKDQRNPFGVKSLSDIVITQKEKARAEYSELTAATDIKSPSDIRRAITARKKLEGYSKKTASDVIFDSYWNKPRKSWRADKIPMIPSGAMFEQNNEEQGKAKGFELGQGRQDQNQEIVDKPSPDNINKVKKLIAQSNANTIDVLNPAEIQKAGADLFNFLKNYVSGPGGLARLNQAYNNNYGISDVKVEKLDNPGWAAMYTSSIQGGNPDYSGRGDPRTGKISFKNRLSARNIVQHEMTHGLQNQQFQFGRLGRTWVEEARNRINAFADRGAIDAWLDDPWGYPLLPAFYTPQQIRQNPVELLSTLVQNKDPILALKGDPDFKRTITLYDSAMKTTMKASGYKRGGVVYAQNGMEMPSETDLMRDFGPLPERKMTYEQRKAASRAEGLKRRAEIEAEKRAKKETAIYELENRGVKIKYTNATIDENPYGLDDSYPGSRPKTYEERQSELRAAEVEKRGRIAVDKQREKEKKIYERNNPMPNMVPVLPEILPQTVPQQSIYGFDEYKRGGVVYASKGALVNYQPRGTDTVPAMLTPGEFVVNRQATQKHLPLLKQINSSNYADGGIVGAIQSVVTQLFKNKPAQAAPVPSANITNTNQLDSKLFDSFNVSIQNFGQYIDQLSKLNIPNKIEVVVSMPSVNVNITGASAFEALQSNIQQLISDQITSQMSSIWTQTFGEVGFRPGG